MHSLPCQAALTPRFSCKRVNRSAARSLAQSSDRLSAATFVRPQSEALAMRGPDCIPASRDTLPVRSMQGERLRRSSCLRVRGWCFWQILRYLQKCSPVVECLGRSDNPGIWMVSKWFNPQPLTKFFTPCPTRLGEKSWSDSQSDQPPSATWRRRSTCNSHRSCSTSRCSNKADWSSRRSAGECGRMRSRPNGSRSLKTG